jgi:exodeoxyribonuclease V alpha subunit
VHGGVKFYRGAARAARLYVERDRSRADDYYLAEGTGVAARLVATPGGVVGAGAVVVSGSRTWSLAAALHPEVSEALDAAQDQGAEQIIGWVAEHATTRVGPRGRQVQVPVEQVETAVIRHYTSRPG